MAGQVLFREKEKTKIIKPYMTIFVYSRVGVFALCIIINRRVDWKNLHSDVFCFYIENLDF